MKEALLIKKLIKASLIGIGIGLYLTELIIEKFGGKIEVESQIDVGSTLRIILPIESAGQDGPTA